MIKKKIITLLVVFFCATSFAFCDDNIVFELIDLDKRDGGQSYPKKDRRYYGSDEDHSEPEVYDVNKIRNFSKKELSKIDEIVKNIFSAGSDFKLYLYFVLREDKPIAIIAQKFFDSRGWIENAKLYMLKNIGELKIGNPMDIKTDYSIRFNTCDSNIFIDDKGIFFQYSIVGYNVDRKPGVLFNETYEKCIKKSFLGIDKNELELGYIRCDVDKDAINPNDILSIDGSKRDWHHDYDENEGAEKIQTFDDLMKDISNGVCKNPDYSGSIYGYQYINFEKGTNEIIDKYDCFSFQCPC